MTSRMVRFMALALAVLAATPGPLNAQDQPPPVAGDAAPIYTAQQLDQLLAPIALYPDALLGQILIASTYPLEVVEASRWLADPRNAQLKGDDLAQALDGQNWDPSVKALVPFPQVVATMNERLDWMQALGDAFLAQQAGVMDSVQRLRQQAQAAGSLATNQQQVVRTQEREIIIEPARPTVIYVPVYDPTVVYGAWAYPDYPPIYLPPPPAYYFGPPVFAGLAFGIGFAVVPRLWHWCEPDWRTRQVRINVNQFNTINQQVIVQQNRPPATAEVWSHDPWHHRGVAYRDPVSRERYPGARGGADDRQAFRGRLPSAPAGAAVLAAPLARSAITAAPAVPPAQANQPNRWPGRDRNEPGRAGPQAVPQAAASAVQAARPTPPTPAPPAAAPTDRRWQERSPTEFNRIAPAARAPQPTPAPIPAQRVAPAPPIAPPARPAAIQPRPMPPAFEGFGRGADARGQAERGHASRGAMAPPQAMPQAAAPVRIAPPPAVQRVPPPPAPVRAVPPPPPVQRAAPPPAQVQHAAPPPARQTPANQGGGRGKDDKRQP